MSAKNTIPDRNSRLTRPGRNQERGSLSRVARLLVGMACLAVIGTVGFKIADTHGVLDRLARMVGAEAKESREALRVFEAGVSYRDKGHLRTAALAFRFVAEKYPDLPLAEAARKEIEAIRAVRMGPPAGTRRSTGNRASRSGTGS